MAVDEVDASRAPLLDHLIELRGRIIKALLAWVLAIALAYVFAEDIYGLLVKPLAKAYEDAGREGRLIFTAPQEAFFTYMKVAIFGGLCIAFPYIAYQTWAFVAPGLYKSERGAFLPFLIASPVLFVLGASLVYFIIMPLALKFFLGFETTSAEGKLPIQLESRVSEYLNLIITLMFAFGLCFQLPVLITLLGRVGLVTSTQLKKGRRYAIFGVFVVAAVVTPPDPVSQISLAVPVCLLYELSLWSVVLIERARRRQEETAEAEERAPA